MHKKLLSIALGAILTLSTIAPTFALPDYVNDGINAKYVNICLLYTSDAADEL